MPRAQNDINQICIVPQTGIRLVKKYQPALNITNILTFSVELKSKESHGESQKSSKSQTQGRPLVSCIDLLTLTTVLLLLIIATVESPGTIYQSHTQKMRLFVLPWPDTLINLTIVPSVKCNYKSR